MSVAHLLDTVTEWVRANVCEQIKLKQPPMDADAPDDSGYKYKLVTPAAFPMYVPSSEKLPPSVHTPTPSVCVRFTNGEDSFTSHDGFVDLQLCFSTWNPGTHGRDKFDYKGGTTFQQRNTIDFDRNGDGWRDAWNFVDIALRAVESVTSIGGYAIDRHTPVRFGPLMEQDSIPDFYPYWFAVVGFRVKYSLLRNVQDYQHLL